MIIKKNDISSIFPIIINKMIAVFEDVNKLEKLIVSNPCNSEFTVFVRVKMDSLNDF